VSRHILENDWGGMARSMFTLFASITGGISWCDVHERILEVGLAYAVGFICFLFCMFFSVLNVVTGIVVDDAIQMNNSDRAVRKRNADRLKTQLQSDIYEVLTRVDSDGTGLISGEQFSTCMEDPHVAAMMAGMEVATGDPEQLFSALDVNSDGDISVLEFVEGLQRIHGAASGLDMHAAITLIRIVIKQNDGLLSVMETLHSQAKL